MTTHFSHENDKCLRNPKGTGPPSQEQFSVMDHLVQLIQTQRDKILDFPPAPLNDIPEVHSSDDYISPSVLFF